MAAALGLALLPLAGCPGDDGTASGDGSSGTGPAPTSGTAGTTDSTGTPDGTGSSGESSADTTAGTTGEPMLPARLGVTADFEARTLSVLDLDAIAGGARSREEIVARTIDLSAYAPGPLQVELAPDGLTAVVSVSPGFFGGFVGNIIGVTDLEQDGTLLVVELDTGTITEVPTMHVPMGIAITPDGSRAFTANYGLDDPQGSTLSVIDLPARAVIDEVEVGARPEQVSLDPTGTIGLLNVVGLGGVRAFEVADPAGTLSAPLVVGNDPSDVDFIAGTDYAVVANSLDPSNYVVIDVSDPANLSEVAVGPPPLGSVYAITAIAGTTDVLVGATDFSTVYIKRIEVGGDGTPTEQWERTLSGASFPLGIAHDGDGGVALMAAPGINGLLVQQLDDATQVLVPWQEEIGPTYVAVAP